jgi:hypothetical protein
MLTKDVLNNLEGTEVLVADCMIPAALFAGELKQVPTVALTIAVCLLVSCARFREAAGRSAFPIPRHFFRAALSPETGGPCADFEMREVGVLHGRDERSVRRRPMARPCSWSERHRSFEPEQRGPPSRQVRGEAVIDGVLFSPRKKWVERRGHER